MSAAIFLHASKVVDGKLVKGIVMYPTDTGCWKSDDKEAFSNLFEGKAPPVPYGGIGKKFGPEKFALQEIQTAVLQHMQKHFSLPKDKDAYWKLDGEMHEKLVFHPAVVHGKIGDSETPTDAALRLLWEWTGMRVDPKELKGEAIIPASPLSFSPVPIHVFHMDTSLDRARWFWMDHQAERLTLTDWEVSPYPDVLQEMGVPDLVYKAYCRTHGGPAFIKELGDVKDNYTVEVMSWNC